MTKKAVKFADEEKDWDYVLKVLIPSVRNIEENVSRLHEDMNGCADRMNALAKDLTETHEQYAFDRSAMKSVLKTVQSIHGHISGNMPSVNVHSDLCTGEVVNLYNTIIVLVVILMTVGISSVSYIIHRQQTPEYWVGLYNRSLTPMDEEKDTDFDYGYAYRQFFLCPEQLKEETRERVRVAENYRLRMKRCANALTECLKDKFPFGISLTQIGEICQQRNGAMIKYDLCVGTSIVDGQTTRIGVVLSENGDVYYLLNDGIVDIKTLKQNLRRKEDWKHIKCDKISH